MAAPVGSNSNLPDPPSMEDFARKKNYFKWKRAGGNPESYLKNEQAESQQTIKKKLEEVAGTVQSEQKQSEATIEGLIGRVEAVDPVAVSKDKSATLQGAVAALKEVNHDLQTHLEQLNSDLNDMSKQKKDLSNELHKIRTQKDKTPFHGEQTLYSWGQSASQNIANNNK